MAMFQISIDDKYLSDLERKQLLRLSKGQPLKGTEVAALFQKLNDERERIGKMECAAVERCPRCSRASQTCRMRTPDEMGDMKR